MSIDIGSATLEELAQRIDEADRLGKPRFTIVVRGETYDLNPVYSELIGPNCEVCGFPTIYGLSYLHTECDNKLAAELTDGQYRKTVIPSGLRWAIWKRDNFTCLHCGERDDLTIDHIYPESKGGKTEADNLQTLCRRCNSRKGAR